MELTEDIIYGEEPEQEHTHYVEQNLLVFRDLELKKLFEVLDKYYEDSCKDLLALEQRLTDSITSLNINITSQVNNNYEELKQSIDNQASYTDQKVQEFTSSLSTYIDEVKEQLLQEINTVNSTLKEQITSNYNSLVCIINTACGELDGRIQDNTNKLTKLDDSILQAIARIEQIYSDLDSRISKLESNFDNSQDPTS